MYLLNFTSTDVCLHVVLRLFLNQKTYSRIFKVRNNNFLVLEWFFSSRVRRIHGEYTAINELSDAYQVLKNPTNVPDSLNKRFFEH